MPKPTASQMLTKAMGALENYQDTTGFCYECGYEQDGVEPDARGYECEDCGAKAVTGAEEIILMGGVFTPEE